MTPWTALQKSAHFLNGLRLSPLLRQALSISVDLAKQPSLTASAAIAVFETIPTLYYGRSLAGLNPKVAAASIALSFLGTTASYFLVLQLASRWRWARLPVALVIAITSVTLQIIYFGIYREFATLPTVSVIDFVRQAPQYALALFRARLDLFSTFAFGLLILLVARAVLWGCKSTGSATRSSLAVAVLVAICSFALTREPFMAVSEQAARLALRSSHGPGVVNQSWTPDRVPPTKGSAPYPLNIVIFRLEEIAAGATTLDRPDLPTTPLLKALSEQYPTEALVARQHYANATATDVSVLSIYEGLSPAAELNAHRRVPLVWDYFSSAGYDTSLFVPFHLEWGDFRRRFAAQPGVMNLNKVMDAGNSGLPIIYDNSINDTDLVDQAIAYQEARSWAEPFLQIVSLKMPHAIGEGARINRLSYDEWQNEPAALRDYYNGIRHDDVLADKFVKAIPQETRGRTIRVYVSDHGTRLFERTDGVEELHRLDNYHYETTRVPFVVHVPAEAQNIVPREKVQALAANLSTLATSNIDMVPTLLGLTGIPPAPIPMSDRDWLAGRDLTRPIEQTDVIVQLNTGPLRRWEREHFGLILGNGSFHYMFSMGRELLFDLRADPTEQNNLVGDEVYSNTLAHGRSVADEVDELRRIRQKYSRLSTPEHDDLVGHLGEAQPLRVMVAPEEGMRIKTPDVGQQLLIEYALAPSTSSGVMAVQLMVRVREGAGRLEWRLRAHPSVRHFAHVDTLQVGDTHQLEFLWRPRREDAAPLAIQLYGAADVPNFALALEHASARLADVAIDRELKLLALNRVPLGHTIGVYHLDRFKEHACLRHNDAANCPNGYLVWGPYVKGTKGADVQLRYDIDAERAGAKVWFDLAARGGKERLAKSRVYRIAEPGSHTFELSARLGSDAEGIEGRMNANGIENAGAHTLAVRQAELKLASPAD
jgi:glucan phosphoethanolaminetransferase (alkaline phosphatase superfamily)